MKAHVPILVQARGSGCVPNSASQTLPACPLPDRSSPPHDLPTYLHRLPSHGPTYLQTYLPTFLPTFLLTGILTYLLTHPPTDLASYLAS